jgi:hypothetical protein
VKQENTHVGCFYTHVIYGSATAKTLAGPQLYLPWFLGRRDYYCLAIEGTKENMLELEFAWATVSAGNTKGGSITVLLTSCSTGLD